ncbi:MAG: hypothetical protein WCH39_27140, partial [Schlesneria sp.]
SERYIVEGRLQSFQNVTEKRARVFVLRTEAKVFGWQARVALSESLATVTTCKSGDLDKFHELIKQKCFQQNVLTSVTCEGTSATLNDSNVEPNEEAEQNDKIFLDNAYRRIQLGAVIAVLKPPKRLTVINNGTVADAPQSPLLNPNDTDFLLSEPGGDKDQEPKPFRVNQVNTRPRTLYGVTSETTEISLSSEWWNVCEGFRVFRRTRVFCEAEELALAAEDISVPIVHGSREVRLEGITFGLGLNRRLIIEGVPITQPETVRIQQLVEITSIRHEYDKQRNGDGYRTIIIFDQPLLHDLQRNSVRILANVVEATQGETKQEILGSGAGRVTYPKFPVASAVTYVPAPVAEGVKSELEVQVNGVTWNHVDSLRGQEQPGTEDSAQPETADDSSPNTSQVYVTHRDELQRTTVQFIQVPTGRDNVRVVYRTGMGAAGNVQSGQINQLVGPPPGVKGVVNPLPANGGADPDGVDLIRQRAPLVMRSMDRLISVPDYADFALGFGGIAKADARRVASRIQLTVAGNDPTPLAPTGVLITNLEGALLGASGGLDLADTLPHSLSYVVIDANVVFDPRYKTRDLEIAIRKNLQAAFSFDNADFLTPIFSSTAIQTIQETEGVEYVDLNQFYQRAALEESTQPKGVIDRITPRPSQAGIGAELIYLPPDIPSTLRLTLTTVKSA